MLSLSTRLQQLLSRAYARRVPQSEEYSCTGLVLARSICTSQRQPVVTAPADHITSHTVTAILQLAQKLFNHVPCVFMRRRLRSTHQPHTSHTMPPGSVANTVNTALAGLFSCTACTTYTGHIVHTVLHIQLQLTATCSLQSMHISWCAGDTKCNFHCGSCMLQGIARNVDCTGCRRTHAGHVTAEHDTQWSTSRFK